MTAGLASGRFILVLGKLFSGLAEELQVNDDVRHELDKPMLFLRLRVLDVLLVVHFKADSGNVVVRRGSFALLASQPAVVKLLH